MSIHTKVVGAFDAIILSSTAALHLVVVFVLLDPSYGTVRAEALLKQPSVTIEQLA